MKHVLTPSLLLSAYAQGVFPMSEHQDNPDLFWVEPRDRGIIPLNGFHISRSLARRIRGAAYTVSFDTAFDDVVAGCADRDVTWINETLTHLYAELHDLGHAHSVEVWDGDSLIGGVFGVTLGAAFFGESMFSRQTDASKIALAYLVDRLTLAGFRLFDAQFITDHLKTLGAIEIPQTEYLDRLNDAKQKDADFTSPGGTPTPQDVLQRNAQTS